jgi:hypothetical protein
LESRLKTQCVAGDFRHDHFKTEDEEMPDDEMLDDDLLRSFEEWTEEETEESIADAKGRESLSKAEPFGTGGYIRDSQHAT